MSNRDPTFGQIWLQCLTKSFPSMSEDQAVSLLAKQGGLAKALASGSSNGRGSEITAWLNAVLKARNKIGTAISNDAKQQPAIYSCMNPLFACLFSPEPSILSLAARVILALAQVIPPESTYEVITTAINPDDPRRPNPFVLGVLKVMEKASSKPTRTKMCRFLSIICDMSSKRLRDLLRTHLLNAARSTPLGPSLLHYVVIGMAEIDPNLKDVLCLDNTIIDSITNECITLLETMVDAPESRDRDSTSFNPRREALISQMLSLSDMYAIFGNIAPSFKDNKTQKRILRVLGRGTRHSVLSIQMAATTVLFNLFEIVGIDADSPIKQDTDGDTTSSFGPQVYKALIFLLVESHADAKRGSGFDGVLREYVANLMSSAINILPRVPIDVLVEPLLAQIQLVGCEVYDFELLSNIIIHPRLSKRGASLIANALGRYSLGHPIYWRISDRLLARVVRKFQLQVSDSIVTIVKGAIRLLPPSNGSQAAQAQRWLCTCCLHAIVEVSETKLRQVMLDAFDEISSEQNGDDITEILNILNVECSVSNLPLLTSIDIGSSQDGSKINGSDNDLQLDDDRMELTSAGSDTGSQSMSTNNNKNNNNNKSNNKNNNNANSNENGTPSSSRNSRNNNRSSKRDKKTSSNSNSNSESLRTTPNGGSKYQQNNIKASSLKDIKKENNQTRKRNNSRGDSPRSERSYGGMGDPREVKATSPRTNNSRRKLGTKRPSPKTKQFVSTTLGASVEDDIQRIRKKVEDKKNIQLQKEKEKKLKSQKIRKNMRKKFAHIKAIERPLSPKKPGQQRKSRRHHVEARKLRADECYATALRVVAPWTIPLRHVFDHYIAISKGFIRAQSVLEDFEESSSGWSTMQQNEFLMCMTDMGIVPSMITKRRALHIFHMVTTGANSPDSVNFDLFRSVVLIVSRQSGVLCQDLPTDIARVNALCSWFRIRSCRAELIYNLFNPENRDVQLGIKSYADRIGGVVQWEDGSTPECDYTRTISTRLKKGSDSIADSISICVEILDDLLGKIFGWAVQILFLKQDVAARPSHSELGPKICTKIVNDTLSLYAIEENEIIRNEVRTMFAVHARRSLSHNVGAIHYMSMYENCIMKAKKIQITEASKNNMYVELKKKELILLPHHKEAIERLYKPSEAPPNTNKTSKNYSSVIMSNRIGFGGGVPKEEVYNEALVTIPPKPKYRFGQSTIDKLHVRHIPPAKILISVLNQIVEYVVSGKARKKLGSIYGDKYSYTGGSLPATLDEWKTIKPKAPRIGPKAPVPSATPPVLRPKEKEKHSSAQHRRDLEFVQVQKKRDEDRKKRKKQLDRMLKKQKKEKAEAAEQKYKDETPMREKLEKQKKIRDEQERLRTKTNKKRIYERQKQIIDSKKEVETKETEIKKKNALSSSIRAESGKARQIEKHKKIHEEAIEKATASGHKEAIKQLGEFDETKALHNDTKKIGLIGEINRKHTQHLDREKTKTEDKEHTATREKHQEDTMARQQIENDLRQQLRFQLEDGTKKPYDYMIGVFKVTLGKAKGLSEVHGIRTADLFNNLDADESGALSKQELTRYLKVRKIDLNSEQIDDIINTFKMKKMVNEDGDIMCEGFISCLQGRLS